MGATQRAVPDMAMLTQSPCLEPASQEVIAQFRLPRSRFSTPRSLQPSWTYQQYFGGFMLC